MLYLHHFTNPIWFDQKGGFERDDSPEILARFTSKVVERLGSKVRLWSTINEPNIYAVEGYYRGTFHPDFATLEEPLWYSGICSGRTQHATV